MDKGKKIDVMITDDHPMIIDGLTNALKTRDHIRVTATYTRVSPLLAALENGEVPDVLLLDAQLPDKFGLDVAQQLVPEYPGMHILIVSSIESHFFIQSMMKLGCKGYLLKSTADAELLVHAIETVYQGSIFLDPRVKEELLFKMVESEKKGTKIQPRITDREKQILLLVVQEYENQEIAKELGISLRTVENHKHHLLQKLGAKNTVGLVKQAMRMGLMP